MYATTGKQRLLGSSRVPARTQTKSSPESKPQVSSTFTLHLLPQTDTNRGSPGTDESVFSRPHVFKWGNRCQTPAWIFFLLLHTPGLSATRQGIRDFDDVMHVANFFWGLMTNKVWKQQESSGCCILPLLFSVYWVPTWCRAECAVPRMQKGIRDKRRNMLTAGGWYRGCDFINS